MLVVAALLLTNLTGIAAAADTPEHPSKNAQKLIATLNALGINSPEVQDFMNEVNSHVENGYFNFAQQDMMGGKLALRYPVSVPGIPHRLELNYTPNDSHVAVTARTDGIMVSYKLKF
jgi:hypothetical protein